MDRVLHGPGLNFSVTLNWAKYFRFVITALHVFIFKSDIFSESDIWCDGSPVEGNAGGRKY